MIIVFYRITFDKTIKFCYCFIYSKTPPEKFEIMLFSEKVWCYLSKFGWFWNLHLTLYRFRIFYITYHINVIGLSLNFIQFFLTLFKRLNPLSNYCVYFIVTWIKRNLVLKLKISSQNSLIKSKIYKILIINSSTFFIFLKKMNYL